MIGTGTDTSWFDPSVIDPEAPPAGLKDSDPMGLDALRKSRDPSVSQPVPGIAHGSIPGLLGIAMNGGTGPASGAPGLSGGMWRPGGNFPTQAPAMPTGAPLPFMGAEGAAAAPPALPMAPQGAPVPSPQPGPEMAPPAGMPASAAPGADAMAMAPQGIPPQTQGNRALPQGSLLDRLFNGMGNFFDANRMTLMAMGGGLAGSQNWGTGIGRAFQAAGPAQMQDRQIGMQNQTAQMIQQKIPGMTPAMAMSIAANPAAMQQLLPRLMGAKQLAFGVIGKNPYGVEQYGFHDDVSGIVYDQNMHPVGGPGAPAGTGGGVGGVNGSAQGGGIPPDLQGEDLYSAIAAHPQFGPGKANQVRAVVEGNLSFPTGTALRVPGNQWLADMAMQAEPGTTAQDFHARQVTQNDLHKSGNSNLGGIILNGNSAFEHLGTYTDTLANLGNHSNSVLPNWEANTENYLKNKVLGNSETAGKLSAANGAALKYGEESTKFYSGTGGGEAERMAALNNNDPATKSGQELAGFAQSERDLMVGRMREAESKIRSNMGDDYLQKHPVFTPELTQKIQRVDANIARLHGQAPPASQGAAPAAQAQTQAAPPVPNAKQAPDGNWYVPDPSRPGKYLMVK